MRRFSSYRPINDKLHYYAPRKEIIETGYSQLIGENPEEGGHVLKINLEILKYPDNPGDIPEIIARGIMGKSNFYPH